MQTLLPAAGLLQLNDVSNACCEFLKSQLHPTNCLGIRAFADMHSCSDLLQAAHLYIEQHFTDVVSCEEFLQLPSESIIEFISSDKLTVHSEDKVKLYFYIILYISIITELDGYLYDQHKF